MKNEPQLIKIRAATRQKYSEVRKRTRLKYVEVADLAIDALIATDPKLHDMLPVPESAPSDLSPTAA